MKFSPSDILPADSLVTVKVNTYPNQENTNMNMKKVKDWEETEGDDGMMQTNAENESCTMEHVFAFQTAPLKQMLFNVMSKCGQPRAIICTVRFT